MPIGLEKNTKNKALHTKLLNRKKSKLQEEKKEKAVRLKALVAKMNQKWISHLIKSLHKNTQLTLCPIF